MKLFKAEMFSNLYNKTLKEGMKYVNAGDMWQPNILDQDFADLANKILKELIDISPTVYSADVKFEWCGYNKAYNDTYSAKLMFKELIENKQPEIIYVDAGVTLNGEKLYKQVAK